MRKEGNFRPKTKQKNKGKMREREREREREDDDHLNDGVGRMAQAMIALVREEIEANEGESQRVAYGGLCGGAMEVRCRER